MIGCPLRFGEPRVLLQVQLDTLLFYCFYFTVVIDLNRMDPAWANVSSETDGITYDVNLYTLARFAERKVYVFPVSQNLSLTRTHSLRLSLR